MMGCKRAGETPLASRDKPALRIGSWNFRACGVWSRFASEAAIRPRIFVGAHNSAITVANCYAHCN